MDTMWKNFSTFYTWTPCMIPMHDSHAWFPRRELNQFQSKFFNHLEFSGNKNLQSSALIALETTLQKIVCNLDETLKKSLPLLESSILFQFISCWCTINEHLQFPGFELEASRWKSRCSTSKPNFHAHNVLHGVIFFLQNFKKLHSDSFKTTYTNSATFI